VKTGKLIFGLVDMNRLLLLVYLLITGSSLYAQEGALLLTHFKESREIEDQNWAICQDNNNVMLFANRKGILTFDGEVWTSVRIPTIPYSMQADPGSGKIFIGGENSYGFLDKDQMGSYKYIPVSGESSDIGVITRIIFNDSVVWFYGEQSISRHNLKNNRLELRIKAKAGNPFEGMFVTPKNTFINEQNSGLYRLESDTLFPIVTGYLTVETDILFALPYNSNLVLLGLGNGNLSLFDGIKYYDYQIKDNGYLKENILSEGITVGDSLYAFSTLDGGALIIERYSGKIRYTINNQNELPDDEVFALGVDKSNGIWLSHQYGLTRADLNLPVENFSIYPGLKGNLTSSAWYNNVLYVSTSEGVYYLTEVRNYAEDQILIKNLPSGNESPSDKLRENIGPREGTRKNIFRRIFGRIISKEKSVKSDAIEENEAESRKNSSRALYTRKTVSRLKSINYLYKKVEGLKEKCRQLVSTPDGVLAATNKGLLVINDHKAENVAGNRYINFISWQPVNEKYFVAAGDGYFYAKYIDGKWIAESPDAKFTDPVYSIVATDSNKIWLGLDNAAVRVDIKNDHDSAKYTRVSIKNDFPQRYYLDFYNDTIFLYTESGIYFFNNTPAVFVETRTDKNHSNPNMKFTYPLSNMPWIRLGDNWIYLKPEDNEVEKEMSLLKIFDDVISINSESGKLWVVDGDNRLLRVDLNKQLKINPAIDVFVKSIYNDKGIFFDLSDIVFDRGDNIVNFEIVAPGYLKKNTTQYQYIINKLMPDWSPWSDQTKYNLMIPVPGVYTLKVRARDLWGNIGKPQLIKFTIKAPFTRTPAFYILSGSSLLILIFLIIRFRERHLQNENRILELKVKERTAEIEAQKEEITSSIAYASRIQMAMLPMENHFRTFFSDYFIIFKPRDIVSGDFYWIGEDEKNVFFTVADCTGHGVPGAFMSTLGISTLNDIITNNIDLRANTVLNILREKIMTSLHQTGKEGEASDGMDVAFCVLNKNRKSMQFSGAYNPLFLFHKGVFKEYKADRMPIGIYYGQKETFTNYEIETRKGDTLYIFSDGLTDQFGGSDGSKYKKSNLKKLLSEIYNLPMAEQRTVIENVFEQWKGNRDQVDDITVIGVRI
jgi:serine phosphatase RsbU (regulator of sigma subunit)